MERIFAPWRNGYVTSGARQPGCVMCRAVETAGDADSLVVHAGAHCFVVMNLYPYNAGHAMVAPLRHVAGLGQATPEELAEMMVFAQRLESAFTAAYRPDGINLGMNLGKAAGAGVADHMHLHLVPRWNGDANFMSVLGETRVLSEEPAQGAARLRPYFQ
jgi:ATP adenylyltransferase